MKVATNFLKTDFLKTAQTKIKQKGHIYCPAAQTAT